ncbi:ATP-binding protein [Acaryochloris sp. IP29b_bin.137]|uniref:sensor histidine kinase n=1 Tax=Acaryochloris sp. IP29b_bin.137 TaxID=2969217 RepID=UPI0026236EC3|nr:ATP-binding protein [Acaryochloris sp. IP29b_bin.137]
MSNILVNWLQRAYPQQFFRQARTRILLLYILVLAVLMSLAIPLFRYLLFYQIDQRVRADLRESRADFLQAFNDWNQQSSTQTLGDFQAFIDAYMEEKLPADDNYFLILLEDEFYRANPVVLLKPLRPGSPLYQRWLNLEEGKRGEWHSPDPDIGKILYKADPLILDSNQRATYISTHATAGEHNEALEGVYVFILVASGVLIIALMVDWLIAGFLFAPVRSLVKTTRLISETDLSQRIPEKGTGELAELAKTFNAMMDRLEFAFNSQRSFINDAGHELRTPITIVRGHLELMGDDPREQHETISLVLDELDRMGRLVEGMVLLARSERPDFLQLEKVEVSELTKELFAKAHTLASRKWQLMLNAHQQLMCDRQQITGAMLNLLRNASQHTKKEDTIELGCSCTQTEARFWVRDTGTGIAPEVQPALFNRFTRAPNNRQREGSGLGLAIVKAIADSHRGRIELVSEPGVGSTFTLCIPIIPFRDSQI